MKALHEIRLQRGWEVARNIIQKLRSPDILPTTYPALFEGGVAEGSLHSYMLSALLLLGDRLGYSAVCDSPIFGRLDNLLLGEGSKRPDSVWFERETETARVLIEFERYAINSLESKARNLLIMANSCAKDVNLLILMYWTLGARALAELRAAYDLFKTGFTSKGNRFGPSPCPALLLETIAKRHGERLIISSFVAKQFVANGENKGYIVECLNSSRGL